MKPIGYHIRIRLKNDQVIAPTRAERITVARVVLHQGKSDNLLALGLGDTHLHLEAACDYAAAGQLARRCSRRLRCSDATRRFDGWL